MTDSFEAGMLERQRRYQAWLSGMLTEVREAIERRRDRDGQWAGLHIKLLDRIELVLTVDSSAKDADGVLITFPIARKHARTMLTDLAEAYGIEVGA